MLDGQTYNDFCMLCTDNDKAEIKECKDIDCPFINFRRGGLEREVERDICLKLLMTMRMVD